MTVSEAKAGIYRPSEAERRAVDELRRAIGEALDYRREEFARALAGESLLASPGRWLREEIIQRLLHALSLRKDQLRKERRG